MRLTSTLLGTVQHRKVVLASWLALALTASALAVYAVNADGFRAHKAELNDGGVWVTRQESGAVGRQNVQIEQMDTRIWADKPAVGISGLDVLQNGSAVLSHEPGGALMPLDVSAGAGLTDQQVTVVGTPAMGGTSLGVVDPEKGSVWVAPVDPARGVTTLSGVSGDAKPVATVGPDAAIAVSSTGTVVAASASKGTVVTVQGRDGAFESPERSKLGQAPNGEIKQMAVLGDKPAILDDSGQLILGDEAVTVGKDAQLQQSGAAQDEVLAATPDELLSISSSGEERVLAQNTAGENQLARPVRLGECAFHVWWAGGSAHAVTACDGQEPQVAPVPGLGATAELVWRVNRNQIVLNDVVSGDVWKVEGESAEKISNWDAFEKTEDDQNKADPNPSQQAKETPPVAQPDELGIRVGRTSVLHVLDNDQAAVQAILSVVGVTKGTLPDGVTVQVAPDHQSLLATALPTAPTGTYSFTYDIDDGTGSAKSTATGKVVLHVRGLDAPPAAPTLKLNSSSTKYVVTAGRNLEFPVSQEWRDLKNGDPISIIDTVADKGSVSSTAQNMVKFSAPTVQERTNVKIRYAASTGGDRAEGSAQVTVLPTTAQPEPAQTQPDAAGGQVGGAIVIRPLQNDIPGADPLHPDAALSLAGDVAPVKGQSVETDRVAGTVTMRPTKPGVYMLSYSAGFGDAKRAVGQIRVDVTPEQGSDVTPVAGPDTGTIRGQAATTIDVLANDYDPRGGLLAVTEASPVAEDSRLQVAVIEGRWLRVSSTDPQLVDPVQAITYTVSNGSTSGVGSLTLTQEEPLPAEQNSPVPEDDKVTVRAGSVIEIPVLDNDTTPSGDPVALVPVPEDKERGLSVGEYSVLPAGEKSGQAVMAGRRVRFLAPEDDGTLPRDVRIQYAVANTGDPMAPAAMGLVYVHITGDPDKNNPNQDPTPRAVEGRVVQGDTVALRLPPTGLDPDGDPVTIVSIGDTERGAPKLGRVTEINGASMTYQAFPGSTGTDRFSYTVEDPFGKRATGSVSVAVVPPGPPQPPTAVDDLVTADTGRDLEIDVLTNDLRTSGTRLTVEPLENAPEGVSLDEETGLIKLTSPSGNNESLESPYVATNGIDSSKAVLRVRTQKGFDNPPVADDILAAPKGNDDTVTVEVLKHVYDIDDATSDLELAPVKGAEDLGKGRLRIKVTDKAQVLPYQITDPAGAVAVAAIRVSPIASGTPYLKPDALIKIDPGAAKTVELSDLVEDPEGDKVVFTTLDANAFFAAPEGRLRVSAAGTSLKVTAANQTGPGTVTFTVSDREKLSDPEANVAMLTVPVQVGSDKPVITCPSAPLRVAEGGRDLNIDVASVCHVWTADPTAAKGLEFKGSWAGQPPGIDLSNSGNKIRLHTGNGATAGSRGQINVAVSGDEPTAKLNVLVTKLPAPTLAAISVDAHGGDPVKIDLAKYLQTKVAPSSRDIQLVSVKQVSGPQSRASSSGSVLTVTPGEDSFGVLSYRVEVSDMGKTSSRPRATGLVKVSVATRPDAPSGLSTSQELLSNTAALSWRAPNPNGAPITKYVVKYSGGSSGEQTCGASPCRITGLTNGKQYTFAVKAVNAEGESDWSNSASATPDAISEAVGNPRVTRYGDHLVTLAWDKPANSNASAAKRYRITWPGDSHETSSTQADLPVRSNGEDYVFTIVAINDTQLPGATNTATGMGAGRPEAPGKPEFTQTDRAGSNQRAVLVKWGQVAANGPNPVQYQVSRAGLGRPLCDWQTGLTCADDLPLNGATYSYTVIARNAEATSPRAGSKAEYVSTASPAGTMESATTPDPIRINSLVATGANSQVRVDFVSGASHGLRNTVECRVNGASCGSWNYALSGASDVRTLSTSVSNGSTATVQLRACNGSSGGSQTGSSCSAWAQASAVPYGPIGNASISASANGNSVNWSASWDANGKDVKVVITRNGNTLWSSNSTGSGSHSGGDAIGYSQTGNYVITVSDTGNAPGQSSPRAQKSDSRSVTTPPPPPSVSVSKGGNAQGQQGCTVAACRFVVVTTANFPGNVTCQITQAYPNTNGFLTWTQGGNETKQSPNYYGWPGKGITVNCGGVSGSTTW